MCIRDRAYLDTVKIPNSSVKVDVVVQKKNKHNSKFHGKSNGSKHLKVSEVALVITVVPVTL